MTVTIRNVEPADLPGWVDALTTAFLERVDVDKAAEEFARLWDLSRTWAAFDASRVVGTYRSWATELTVPGGTTLPAAAVSAVTVLPTYRRRGVLRQMTAAEHGAIRARGEVFGLLYAAEYPIYGRFGYGPATRIGNWTLDTTRTGFLTGDVSGVELLPANEASRDVLRGVFQRARLARAGEIQRRDYRWDFDLGLREGAWEKRWRGWIVLHRDATGEPDGYALYKGDGKWENGEPHGTLTVNTLAALNDDAYAALWRYLAQVDWIATVKAEGRPLTDRLPWLLTNLRAASISDVTDAIWVRIFDVPRALAARTYERADCLVLDVRDTELDGGRVRVRLDASADGATCEPTDAPVDLEIDGAALGAAYLGGTLLSDAVLPTGAVEHTPRALARATALLRTTVEPWCSTFF